MKKIIARKTTFTGKVQAVGFRYQTKDILEHFPTLTGTVKNIEPDGPYSGNKVELFLQGEREEVEKAIHIVKIYFGEAHLTDVKTIKAKPDTKIKDFKIDYGDTVYGWKGYGWKGNSNTTTTGKNYAETRTTINADEYESCVICGSLTRFKCDCKEVYLCTICAENVKRGKSSLNHVCTKKETLRYISSPQIVDVDRDTGKPTAKQTPENLCNECGHIYTTSRTVCCSKPLCLKCAKTGLHECETGIRGAIKKIMKSVF